MHLDFTAIAEDRPGPRWQALMRRLWPAYQRWYLIDGNDARPDFDECRRALRRSMPELLPLYDRLVGLGGGSEFFARFLSLYRPPAYLAGCSQIVWQRGEPMLVRNYDYSPGLCEGAILATRWLGRRVVAMSDCLWGALDGMNEDGLAVSITFGGRRVIGDGFGIPVVVRYLLETCASTAEAIEALRRIPIHMAYNVTLLDRGGEYATLFLGPDRPAEALQLPFVTNHQGEVEWADHARFTASVERERHLSVMLANPRLKPAQVLSGFNRKPLYSTAFSRGFGTLYTAVYKPQSSEIEYRWPGFALRQSTDCFLEGTWRIAYRDGGHARIGDAEDRPALRLHA